MTVSSTTSSVVCLGNGVTTSFTYNFISDAASDIQVSYTDANGNVSIIAPANYTLTLNPIATGQLWSIGGSVLYPLVGSPIANGTFLTIQRILPYTQPITISNQGDFAPSVIEEMGDTLEMQIQQIAARTTQFRGIWKTGVSYNVGDIVQDGANGSNTKNYYICQIANTSGTWTTDLGNGDWGISVVATVPTGSNSITITGDITASGTTGTPFASTLATVNANTGQFAGITLNNKGLATAATALTGDITSAGAVTTLATVNSNIGSFTAANITVNAKGLITAAASGGAGALTLLATVNASAAASVAFSSAVITNTYNKYVIEFDSVVTSASADININISTDNGSTYITGSAYQWSYIGVNSATSNFALGSATDSKMVITGANGLSSSNVRQGHITFSKPSATAICNFDWNYSQSGAALYAAGAGFNTNTTATNNVKISPGSGTITGNFKLYGLS